jgi:glycosyltransferase involved in cell wall biosynthesis
LDDFDHAVACASVNLDRETSPRDVSNEMKQAGIPVNDLGVRRGAPQTIVRATLRLARLMWTRRPDLVHSSLVHANLLAFAATPPKTPLVASIVSVTPWTAGWQARAHRLLSRRADVVLANSSTVAKALIASGEDPARIRCLPYGVDAERFSPSGPNAALGRGKIVLGVGRLIDIKGFSDLIAAAADMTPKPRVALVGEGPLAAALETQAARAGVGLVLAGGVDDIAPYLRRASVVAISSHWEGVPNVLLEALAAGRPVVASDVGGIPEIVTDGQHAVLVPPANHTALARGLERALGDEGAEIARRGRELVLEHHDWNRYIDERRALYEDVVRTRSKQRSTWPVLARGLKQGVRRDGRPSLAKRKTKEDGLVLVVPKAGADVTEHFAHTFRLAQHVERHTRTAVIVERLAGELPKTSPSVETYIQRHADGSAVRRAWELITLGVRLRRKGFRSFFVRTSQTAAVPLIVIRRLLGGRVMYWNCGKAPKNSLLDVGFRTALKSELPMRAAFRWADTLVTGTPSLAEYYSRTYGIPRERVAVLPNEIDLARFKPPEDKERREARAALGITDAESMVLSVHRFSPVRRTLLYVPSVIQAVIERHTGVLFVFAGGGPEEPQVRRAVSEARLDDLVMILGAVPHERIKSLYAAADIFMMPSYTEGFPRVILEAMAMRVPLAATDVGGVREVVPSVYRDRLAAPDRPLELAHAVDELLSEPATARELANEGRRWVRQFDAPHVASRLVALASG